MLEPIHVHYLQVLDHAHCLTCHTDYKPSDLDSAAHCEKTEPSKCTARCGKFYRPKNPLADALKKHPNAYLHYHDSQAWELFAEKPDLGGTDLDDNWPKLLLEGDDSEDDGYLPSIVRMLCDIARIEAGSE